MFPQGMAANYSLFSVSTHGIVFVILLHLIFFYLTVVLILNTLEYVNVSGPFEFWMKLVLLCLMSLSLGGLVCLKLWHLFRWVLCVSTFRLAFRGRHFPLDLIRA